MLPIGCVCSNVLNRMCSIECVFNVETIWIVLDSILESDVPSVERHSSSFNVLDQSSCDLQCRLNWYGTRSENSSEFWSDYFTDNYHMRLSIIFASQLHQTPIRRLGKAVFSLLLNFQFYTSHDWRSNWIEFSAESRKMTWKSRRERLSGLAGLFEHKWN